MTTDTEWLQANKAQVEKLTKERDEARLAFGILTETYDNLRAESARLREHIKQLTVFAEMVAKRKTHIA